MTEPGPTSAGIVGVGRPGGPPSRAARLWAVVLRHWTVYRSTLLANALPAFFEPILFLASVGLGLGSYVDGGEGVAGLGGLRLAAFMGPGALAMTAMFTAAFETTYGAFVRLVYQKTYDGMLTTPLSPQDVFLGEILWCGCKGFAFTVIVLGVYFCFGFAQGWADQVSPWCALTPLVGFSCSVIFAGLGLHMAALTKNMNNFNFFISGVLSPMALFSGMVFPVSDLPLPLEVVAYALPLFHVTELNRLLMFGAEACVSWVWLSPLYLLLAAALVSWNGIRLMNRRIVA